MKKRIGLMCCICGMAALCFTAGQVVDASKYALRLCAELIIPSLLPFFAASILLSRVGLPYYLGKLLRPVSRLLFRVSGAGGTALFIGLLGGYPLGAAYISDMESGGLIDPREGERLLAFCNNSGPAFIVGAVGVGVFGSAQTGLQLYLCHILSAVITGVLLRSLGESGDADMPPQAADRPLSGAVTDAVKQAVTSVLNVCGFVVCFTVLVSVLDAGGSVSLLTGTLSALTGLELHWVRSLLVGLLELGSGIGCMRGLSPAPLNLALASLLLGFGGLSVQFQTMAVIADSGIKGSLHFAGCLMRAVIAAGMIYGWSIMS